MLRYCLMIALAMLLAACAVEDPYDPLQHYEQLEHTGIVVSPQPVGGRFAPIDRDVVERGRYLVEMLGCGACHTDGAFEGAPDTEKLLAGSATGIAYTNPLETRFPGVVFPSNITPHEETGIGRLSDSQVGDAIRMGMERHGRRRLYTMPWPGYTKLHDEDVGAIVAYLRSIPAINHEVPAEIRPGQRASLPFVYFGVYRTRD